MKVALRVALIVGPPGSRAGTRSWEAEHTVTLIDRAIAISTDPVEIAFLTERRAEQVAIAESGDMSPGRGVIALPQR